MVAHFRSALLLSLSACGWACHATPGRDDPSRGLESTETATRAPALGRNLNPSDEAAPQAFRSPPQDVPAECVRWTMQIAHALPSDVGRALEDRLSRQEEARSRRAAGMCILWTSWPRDLGECIAHFYADDGRIKLTIDASPSEHAALSRLIERLDQPLAPAGR